MDNKTETKVKDRGLPTDFPTSRVNRGNQTLLSMLFVIEFEIPKFRDNASLMELCFSRLDYRQFGIHHIYSLKMLIMMIMTNILTNIRIIMLMLLIFDGNGNFQNHIIFFRGFV